MMGEAGKRNNRRRRDHDDRFDNRANFKRRQIDASAGTSTSTSTSASDASAADKPLVFRIVCPDSVIGSVIGKGGKVINSIRQDSRARVKVMDPYLGSDKRVITVSSFSFNAPLDLSAVDELNAPLDPLCPAQAALLKLHQAIVDALANARENDKSKGDTRQELSMLVPASQAAAVIGKGGSTIKRIRAATRAVIKVNPKDPADATHSCALDFDNFLYIAGEPESVKRALFAVSTIMCKVLPKEDIPLEASGPQDLPASIIIPSDVPVYPSAGFFQPTDPARPSLTPHITELPHFSDTASALYAPPVPVAAIPPPARSEELVVRVICPRNKIGRVIGKGGSTVKNIRQNTGARIDVDDNYKDVDSSLITVISTERTNDVNSSGVEAVLALQEKINDEDKDTAVMQFLVPKKIIGCLIGKGGSIINDMRKRTNAEIHITKDDPKRPNSLDELVQVSGEVASVRDALVHIILRLREDALRDRDETVNSSRDTTSSKPVLPAVDMLYPSTGLPLSSGLPSAPHLSYDHRAPLDVDRGRGVYPSTGLYGYSSLPVDDSHYGAVPSYSSKSYVGTLPYVEMVIPGNALSKVLGKGGANLDNIRRISGAHIEIVDSRSSHYDRIAQISGTPQQQQSAEDLIKAFILSA